MALYTAGSFKSELNNRGWRLTPQRETILHIFQNLPSGNHLSAEDLYNLLKSRGEAISLSTIYRSLKLMARMGILRELELAEGHKHYEINQPYPHHHHHLVCVQCNKTIEFTNDSISKIGMKQAEKSALHLLDCQMTIHTVCHEALRMGWPSMISTNWTCSQAIAKPPIAKPPIEIQQITPEPDSSTEDSQNIR
ncbi:MAG: transcriptional repressor [Oscillatoriales cyanobacterium RM2_1_1]|nr:transcriptional repressor [Oscillatoriales cyanobacterium SM2_3_0]NJO45339.1 transcriptional repressor [Oscillatoriales cyanobacterium RM2_1_1]